MPEGLVDEQRRYTVIASHALLRRSWVLPWAVQRGPRVVPNSGYLLPQLQVSPQRQSAPQSQPARRVVAVFWQPQVQAGPEQGPQSQMGALLLMFVLLV